MSVEWLEKLEAILFHSAVMVGGASDAVTIQGQAAAMAPSLQRAMPFDAVDAVYTRWLADTLADPDSRAMMVTAHGLISTWSTIQAEFAASRARAAEQAAQDYRAQARAELKAHPRRVFRISDLASRDGVRLPWAVGPVGASEEPQDERREGEWTNIATPVQPDLTKPLSTEEEEARQAAREERNREQWMRFAAEHERNLVDKTGEGRTNGNSD